ncbi:MAG: chromosome partitioning protein ParB [Gammaproteobacteria bacterium]|nr:MAG: chromosome partitioning protein ParB [Gammaproteobacteria bacterium]
MDKKEIEQWPIDRFIEYENNPRINDHVVDQFAELIERFGFRVPMLVKSDGLIVDGHFRLKAARKIGLKLLPVILCDDMSDDEIRAFRLSVNKAAELADWDMDLLAEEIKALQDSDFNVEVLGFDAVNLISIMSGEGAENDVDDVWQGMPECDNENIKDFQNVIIHFDSQDGVDDFCRLMGQKITPKTKYLWHQHLEKHGGENSG